MRVVRIEQIGPARAGGGGITAVIGATLRIPRSRVSARLTPSARSVRAANSTVKRAYSYEKEKRRQRSTTMKTDERALSVIMHAGYIDKIRMILSAGIETRFAELRSGGREERTRLFIRVYAIIHTHRISTVTRIGVLLNICQRIKHTARQFVFRGRKWILK